MLQKDRVRLYTGYLYALFTQTQTSLKMKKALKVVCITWLMLVSAQAYSQVAYDITWWYEGVKYRGLLVPQDGDWFYRVRYVANGYIRMIDQSMTPVTYANRIILHGCCPVFSGTSVRCSTYSADNLIIYEDGSAANYDDNGASLVNSITPIYSNQVYKRLWNTVFLP